MKRIITLAIVALVIVAVIVFAFLFFRGKDAGTDGGVGPSGTLPGVNGQPFIPADVIPLSPTQNGLPTEPQPVFSPREKFGLVAQNLVRAYFVDGDNNALLIQPDGQIVKITKKGDMTVLSSTPIANLGAAAFSFDGQKVLASLGSRSAPEESVFDIKTKVWQPLPRGIQNPAWSPTSNEIAYFISRGGRSVLETIDVAKPQATPKELLKLHAQDLVPVWITRDQILLTERASALARGSVWRFDVKSKALTPVLTRYFGLETAWNASGSQGLAFQSAVGRTPSISLVGTSGGALYDLNFSTLREKCLFGATTAEVKKSGAPKTTSTEVMIVREESLYCAVPRNAELLRIHTVPDDYLKRVFFTVDDFYKIGLQDGNATSLFADQTRVLDAHELQAFNNRLFFINRYDERLYAISLTE